jgi:hypothetical protein
MISILPKKPVVQAVSVATVVDDMYIDYIPLQSLPVNSSAGHDFNIIRVVTDHAPQRIDDITKQVADYEQKIKKLRLEATQLRRLLSVLNTKISPSA